MFPKPEMIREWIEIFGSFEGNVHLTALELLSWIILKKEEKNFSIKRIEDPVVRRPALFKKKVTSSSLERIKNDMGLEILIYI